MTPIVFLVLGKGGESAPQRRRISRTLAKGHTRGRSSVIQEALSAHVPFRY